MSDLTHYERNLPHRLPPGSEIFLTLRLADSLPAAQLAQLQMQFAKADDEAWGEASYARQRRYFGRFDALLDAGHHGPTWLCNPAVANVVAGALRHHHGNAYTLVCYCLMPNHVHLVVSLPDDAPFLSTTLQHLKRYTARQANQQLGRTGQFWQRETYDHVVRSPQEMTRIIAYVVNNPVKAGLVANWEDWPYTYWPEP